MEPFQTSLVACGQWLLKTTSQGSLLVCLILLIKVVLRDRLPARWHYLLWLVLLARLVLPWTPPSRISVYRLIPYSLPSSHATSAVSVTRSGGTGARLDVPTGDAPLARGATADRTAIPPGSPSGDVEPTVVVPRVTAHAPGGFLCLLASALPWVWLAGAALLAGRILIRVFGLRRIVGSERPVTDQQTLDLLEDCKMQMQVRTLVGVVITDKVKTPALFGFLRPRILLPQGLTETLGPDGLHCVFLHELAHLKRRDIYLAWLVCLLQVLHWFNPLIWFAFRRMRADQEVAADALALTAARVEESRRYGQTIVGLIERLSRPQDLPSLAGIVESPSHIERRIRAIAGFERDSRRSLPWVVALLILVACISLTDARREKAGAETTVAWIEGAGAWVNYTSGAQITAMVEDGDFLWVGGYGGLTKLNKKTGDMVHYNRANSDLPDNGVSSLARDAQGALWIGTRGGLAQFDGACWTTYPSETCVQPQNGVGCLAIDENGVKWVGVYGRGLARFDGAAWTFYTEANSGLPTDDIRSLAIDAKGNKWLGTNGRGLVKFDGSNWTVYDPGNSGIPGLGAYPVIIDANDDVWVGGQGWNCRNGLAKFDGTSWIVYDEGNSRLPANCVRSIAIDVDGSKWIGTYRGLARFDGAQWTVYATDPLKLAATDCMSLPDKDVWSILVDSEGVKWFGFYGGLVRFDGTTWTAYNTGNSLLPDNHVTSMAVGAEGTKWLSTWGGGVAKFDGTAWTIYNGLNSDIPNAGETARVLAVDRDNSVWLAISGRLVRFDGTAWTAYTMWNSKLPGAPRCVAVDAEGHKWIGTTDGLAEFDGREWTVYRTENSPLPSNDVGVVVIDKEENKWIGGGSSRPDATKGPKGLMKFDGADWTVYNTDNSGLPSNCILCLAVDGAGNKWIGTDRGLVKFNGTDWTVYAPVGYRLTAAPDGSVWGLEMSRGTWNLFRVSGDHWTVIDLEGSGLPSWGIESLCVDREGGLWFGTSGGLAWLAKVNLDEVKRKPASSVGYVFALESVQRDTDKPIALPVPLAQFPRTLNGWTGEDLLISPTIHEFMRANRPDEYLNRRYVDGETGHWADLYVVYCSSNPMYVCAHGPENFYPLNGWTWDQTDPLLIPTQSGRRIDSLAHRFHRSFPTRQDLVVLSFYVVSGQILASEQGLIGQGLHSPNTSRNPALYGALVQVASTQESFARSAACVLVDRVLGFLPGMGGAVDAEPLPED